MKGNMKAHYTKRMQTAKKKIGEETAKRIQRAKALIQGIKSGGLGKEENERREEIFGRGSRQEIGNATMVEGVRTIDPRTFDQEFLGCSIPSRQLNFCQ